MKNFKPPAATRLALAFFGAALLVNSSWPLTVAAQDNTPDPAAPKDAAQPSSEDPAAPKDAAQPSSEDPDLAAQIAELRDKVGRLEALLRKSQGSGMTSDPPGGMGMMDMDKTKDMSAMGGDKAEMDGMGDATMAMMDQQMMQMMQMMQQMMEMKMTGIKSQHGQGMGGDMDMKEKGMDMKDKGMDMNDKGKGMMGHGGQGMGQMKGGEAEAGGSASGTMEEQVKQMMQMQALQMKMMKMKMMMME